MTPVRELAHGTTTQMGVPVSTTDSKSPRKPPTSSAPAGDVFSCSTHAIVRAEIHRKDFVVIFIKTVCKVRTPKASDYLYSGYVALRKRFQLIRAPKVLHFTVSSKGNEGTIVFYSKPEDKKQYGKALWKLQTDEIGERHIITNIAREPGNLPKAALLSAAARIVALAVKRSLLADTIEPTSDSIAVVHEHVLPVEFTDPGLASAFIKALRRWTLP
jgi:hypothetical protein